jgi:hypothetical protein
MTLEVSEMQCELMFGGLVQGSERKTREDGQHEHYFTVTGIDTVTGRTVQYEVDSRSDLDSFRAIEQGSAVTVELVAFSVRVKKFRRDGSEYASRAWELVVKTIAPAAAAARVRAA